MRINVLPNLRTEHRLCASTQLQSVCVHSTVTHLNPFLQHSIPALMHLFALSTRVVHIRDNCSVVIKTSSQPLKPTLDKTNHANKLRLTVLCINVHNTSPRRIHLTTYISNVPELPCATHVCQQYVSVRWIIYLDPAHPLVPFSRKA